jgi:hypothetical protein
MKQQIEKGQQKKTVARATVQFFLAQTTTHRGPSPHTGSCFTDRRDPPGEEVIVFLFSTEPDATSSFQSSPRRRYGLPRTRLTSLELRPRSPASADGFV